MQVWILKKPCSLKSQLSYSLLQPCLGNVSFSSRFIVAGVDAGVGVATNEGSSCDGHNKVCSIAGEVDQPVGPVQQVRPGRTHHGCGGLGLDKPNTHR